MSHSPSYNLPTVRAEPADEGLYLSDFRKMVCAFAVVGVFCIVLAVPHAEKLIYAFDIFLVVWGAWFASLLVQDRDHAVKNVAGIFLIFLVAFVSCVLFVAAIGYFVFLPDELAQFGIEIIFGIGMVSNFKELFFGVPEPSRFSGLFDHLWFPALALQCGALLFVLHKLAGGLPNKMIRPVILLFLGSLGASLIAELPSREFPLESLWVFMWGAIPVYTCQRLGKPGTTLNFGFLLLALALAMFVLGAASEGFIRLAFVFGTGLVIAGSQPNGEVSVGFGRKRDHFAFLVHLYLWSWPVWVLCKGFGLYDGSTGPHTAHILIAGAFAACSWGVWRFSRKIFGNFGGNLKSPLFALSALVIGVVLYGTNGVPDRFSQVGLTYIDAANEASKPVQCKVSADGPLSGLDVCHIGGESPARTMIWGDEQALAMIAGLENAARKVDASAILVGSKTCPPVSGLQVFHSSGNSGETPCAVQNAQIIQALPHLPNITKVILVADWPYYMAGRGFGLEDREVIRLAPNDGAPYRPADHRKYLVNAVDQTIHRLRELDLDVSVVRSVPKQPVFNVEIAARKSAPGGGILFGLPDIKAATPVAEVADLETGADELFKSRQKKYALSYLDTWPSFCNSARCEARAGRSTFYKSPSHLSRSGALALSGLFEHEFH